jgi:hypothetical protein
MSEQKEQAAMPRRRKTVPASDAAARAAELIPDPTAGGGLELPRASTRVDTDEAPGETDLGAFAPPERGSWGTIIETVLTVDPEVVFERLTEELSLDYQHTDYASVAKALDLSDRRYFEASLLVRAAKLAEQQVDRDVGSKMEILRTDARQKLEAEKRAAAAAAGSKATGKATLEEVSDRTLATFPDEVRALKRRSEEFHAARAVAEELAAAWRSRASSLREMVAGLRGR